MRRYRYVPATSAIAIPEVSRGMLWNRTSAVNLTGNALTAEWPAKRARAALPHFEAARYPPRSAPDAFAS
jgi:hypothetical protein